ncbi:hypothetical protein LZ554_003535 [Drepanopeziza brunnea f. sp. 'monogermtubi']|nr:hypothetical protein LZ554_003535 [Drepanopeziza brunnea f. sp. 'monogermtubi']
MNSEIRAAQAGCQPCISNAPSRNAFTSFAVYLCAAHNKSRTESMHFIHVWSSAKYKHPHNADSSSRLDDSAILKMVLLLPTFSHLLLLTNVSSRAIHHSPPLPRRELRVLPTPQQYHLLVAQAVVRSDTRIDQTLRSQEARQALAVPSLIESSTRRAGSYWGHASPPPQAESAAVYEDEDREGLQPLLPIFRRGDIEIEAFRQRRLELLVRQLALDKSEFSTARCRALDTLRPFHKHVGLLCSFRDDD